MLRKTKTNPYLNLVNEYLIDSPAPVNINYLYNFGSLLGINLVLLIATGIALSMHYNPSVDLAFISSEHIYRDVNMGWALRATHANGVSMFFILCFSHMSRGLYYGSYKAPRTTLWIIGVIIFIAMMATAFIGYVLIWGQKSLWGATVITNLFSAIPWIGPDQVEFIWGGASVDNPTLNRFFSLHFLLPFILAALVVAHLIALHVNASNNPNGISSTSDRIRFHPYFTSKDLVGLFWFALILFSLVFFAPNLLGDSDNAIPGNPLVTPAQIVPEWYFLSFYAILRSIPDKLQGVVAMGGALLILIPISFIGTLNIRSNRYRPILNFAFWIFAANFLFLMWLGACHVEAPFIVLGQISTFIYFAYFILLMLLG